MPGEKAVFVKKLNDLIKRCPKSGRIVGVIAPTMQDAFWFRMIGFFALLWFALRVIPKPSRASYPCQRVAVPLALSFLAWLSGITGLAYLLKLIKTKVVPLRTILVITLVLVGFTGGYFAFSNHLFFFSKAEAGFKHADGPNQPMGTAKGIMPGRVAWVHDPSAITYTGKGMWWEDRCNDQEKINHMVSQTIILLTNVKDEKSAWDKLFRSFNKEKGKGDTGYQVCQKIAIKINQNNSNKQENNNNINTSPQLMYAVVKQLIEKAGVPPNNITVFDASRVITNNVYEKLKGKNGFPDINLVDHFGGNGRIQATYVKNAIPFSIPHGISKDLAECMVEADYVINLAVLKGHGGQGVTLCGKNYYGTTGIDVSPKNNRHDYFNQDQSGKPGYLTFVDFMAHQDMGDKTILFFIDGLYGSKTVGGTPTLQWQMSPFNDAWPSSIFASQDGVAIDSVGIDFLTTEFPDARDLNYCDQYLHESSMITKPASKTVYDPEKDDKPVSKSLGTHEHWNNYLEKKYSRNLSKDGKGIELVYILIQ